MEKKKTKDEHKQERKKRKEKRLFHKGQFCLKWKRQKAI